MEEIIPHPVKVDPNSASYLQTEQAWQERTRKDDQVFGAGIPESKRIVEKQPFLAPIYGALLRRSRGSFNSQLQSKLKIISNSEYLRFDEIQNSVSPFVSLLKEGQEANEGDVEVYQRAIDLLTDRPADLNAEEVSIAGGAEISDESFSRMIAKHLENFEVRQEEFAERLPGLKKSFVKHFKKFAKDHNINISGEKIDRVIESTRVRLADPLLEELNDLGGYFEPNVGIFLKYNSPDLESTLVHEWLHALSGRTILMRHRVVDDTERQEIRRKIDHQRIGLRIGKRFSWLNEAVTQSLANHIRPERGMTYFGQISVYGELTRNEKFFTGINPKLFLDAYFEDYDPSLPEGERVPHWKQLMHSADAAFGQGTLVKLDNIIREQGVHAAEKFLHNKRVYG